MKKIEHIGIAVKNLDESNELFTALFGKKHYKIESNFFLIKNDIFENDIFN